MFVIARQKKALQGFSHDKTCMTRGGKSKKNFDFNVCPHEIMHMDPINVDDDYMDALDEPVDFC